MKPTVKRLLLEHYSEADAERIATKLSSGEWTHDYALDVAGLRELEFIPLPYTAPQPAVRPRGERSSD